MSKRPRKGKRKAPFGYPPPKRLNLDEVLPPEDFVERREKGKHRRWIERGRFALASGVMMVVFVYAVWILARGGDPAEKKWAAGLVGAVFLKAQSVLFRKVSG